LEGFFLMEVPLAYSTLFFHQEKSFHDHDRASAPEYADKVRNFGIRRGRAGTS
jgi:hypothetical protein